MLLWPVVQASGYSSDQTPSLGTFICHECGPKKNRQKDKKNIMFYGQCAAEFNFILVKNFVSIEFYYHSFEFQYNYNTWLIVNTLLHVLFLYCCFSFMMMIISIFSSRFYYCYHIQHFFNVIEVQLIYNVVLISATQKSVTHTHIYIYILFHIIFHYGLSQDIDYSSQCYTVGPCYLSILYIRVCVC